MSDQKCDEAADKWRNDGNLLFQRGKFEKALIYYNNSICCAIGSDQLSLAYGNRSVVFFEIKQYEKCLENIKLARKYGYPEEKIQKLNEREEKCRKNLRISQVKMENDPWDFFKLSYPSNEKIPFIVNCLELRNDDKYGRFIVTNSDLKTGDIIAIEEPFYKSINKDFSHSRCAHCLKSNMLSLIPCETCTNGE